MGIRSGRTGGSRADLDQAGCYGVGLVRVELGLVSGF